MITGTEKYITRGKYQYHPFTSSNPHDSVWSILKYIAAKSWTLAIWGCTAGGNPRTISRTMAKRVVNIWLWNKATIQIPQSLTPDGESVRSHNNLTTVWFAKLPQFWYLEVHNLWMDEAFQGHSKAMVSFGFDQSFLASSRRWKLHGVCCCCRPMEILYPTIVFAHSVSSPCCRMSGFPFNHPAFYMFMSFKYILYYFYVM